MVIRDSVHGDIALGALEREVLDFPEVQRLRGIKQLGAAYLVYPGCTHTRFEHSLGACHLAHRIVSSLRATGFAVAPDLEELIGAAALLHDVTHAPFGHTLEDERCLFPRHDKGARMAALFAGALGERLEKLGCRRAVGGLLGVEPEPVPAWARQVISSTIDADLLDYLRRDSHYAGVAQVYDDRVFTYFSVDDGQLVINMTEHGMERPDACSETVQLLRMRYFLSERVYYHHTKVAAGAMISKAVELAQAHGALAEGELMGLTDAGLFARLRGVPTAACPDPAVLHLVDALEARRLFKRGFVISARTVPPEQRRKLVDRFHADGRERGRTEAEIARALGCSAANVILYCPALTVMKEAAALVRYPGGVRRLNEPGTAAYSEIEALEARYAQLWRFYVFVPAAHAARAAEVARDVLGFESEFHRPAG